MADALTEKHLNGSAADTDRAADEEREIARRASAGDRRAFAELYDRHVDAVYRYAWYRLRSDTEAEEVTSEVFHRALVAMPAFVPRRPFLAFLYGIARHVVADRFRGTRPQASFEDAMAHPSDAPGPDEIAGRLDDARHLRRAIARLTPLQQEIIVLRYLEDRPTKDVATLTGKPESTVRGIQMRALASLRDLMEHER